MAVVASTLTETSGKCHSFRLKTNCEAPAVPTIYFFNVEVEFVDVCPYGTIGYPITVVVAANTIPSTVSVEDANALACQEAERQAAALRLLSPCVGPESYCNEEQTYTDECPEGTIGYPITVTIPACEVESSVSVAEANAIALAMAVTEAEAERLLSPCIEPVGGSALWGWGRNFRGALGVGNTQVQSAPALIGDAELAWTKIEPSGTFGLGLKSDGTIWSWGANYSGELGQGTQSIWPTTTYNLLYPTQIGSDEDWADVGCGLDSSAGVKTDGTLWTWGGNGAGQLGHNDYDLRTSPTQVGADTDWSKVVVGEAHIMALKTDGTIWGCGFNNGCLGDGTNTERQEFVQFGSDSDWASVFVPKTAAGYNCTVAIKTDGTMWGAGNNNSAWGIGGAPGSYLVPTQLGSDTDWSMWAGGEAFGVALKTTGTIWSTGSNFVGQLGQGNTTNYSYWEQIGTDVDWDHVSCGEYFSTAKKTNGEIYGWGINTNAELGQGGLSAYEWSPVQMGSDDKWSLAAAGHNGVLALRTDLTDPAPPPETNGVASGGTMSISGSYTLHTFNSLGGFTVYTETAMDILRVGGGGAGGTMGGGGGGEVLKEVGVVVPIGNYQVVVPPAALGAFGPPYPAENGGDVSFNGITVAGGGGGGEFSDTIPEGKDGASGGGGGTFETDPFTGQPGGTGSTGTNGGAGLSSAPNIYGGGGGGGDSVAGGNASAAGGGTGGAGGAGTSDSITGTAVVYGSGGGGGGKVIRGAGGGTGGGIGAGFDSATEPAGNGLNGGNGGGGSYTSTSYPAGDGGKGMVIIRYLTPP